MQNSAFRNTAVVPQLGESKEVSVKGGRERNLVPLSPTTLTAAKSKGGEMGSEL